MTKPQAVKLFTDHNRPFNDYWSMQLAWSCFVDGLERDGEITMKQQATWLNPCTPDTFKRFNKKFKGGK
jgi:hypothetical protein